jgi:HlyD family secretion protein
VTIGQKAKITIDAMAGKSFVGHVVEIGNSPISTTGTTSASQATNFLVKVKVDDQIPDVRPGFTCTAEITTATRAQALAIPIQATTVREMVVDKASGAIVRDDPKAKGRAGGGTVEAQELKPSQERKELEGVFVVKDNKALFTPIKTGIAGEKYFEALSGVSAGDQVIIGPFSSVRELKDGGPVKIEAATRGSTADKK